MLWTVLYLQRNILFTYLVQLTCPPRATSSSSCRRRKSPWRKRYVVVYSLCLILFDSKQGINVVLFWSMVSSSGWVPDRNQEGLEKGVIFCDWLSENFGWLFVCLILYLSIVCKCFVTLITAWTAHTIHQSWELSMGCFHICADGDVNGRVNLQFCW